MTSVVRNFLIAASLVASLAGCGVADASSKQDQALSAWTDVRAQHADVAELASVVVAGTTASAQQPSAVPVDRVTKARVAVESLAVTEDIVGSRADLRRYQALHDALSNALASRIAEMARDPASQAGVSPAALQVRFDGARGRVAVARRAYNERARDYNESLRTFPAGLWARTLSREAEPMALFMTVDQKSRPRTSTVSPRPA